MAPVTGRLWAPLMLPCVLPCLPFSATIKRVDGFNAPAFRLAQRFAVQRMRQVTIDSAPPSSTLPLAVSMLTNGGTILVIPVLRDAPGLAIARLNCSYRVHRPDEPGPL